MVYKCVMKGGMCYITIFKMVKEQFMPLVVVHLFKLISVTEGLTIVLFCKMAHIKEQDMAVMG